MLVEGEWLENAKRVFKKESREGFSAGTNHLEIISRGSKTSELQREIDRWIDGKIMMFIKHLRL